MPGVDSFCQFTYPLKVHFRSVKIIDSRHIAFHHLSERLVGAACFYSDSAI